MQLSLPAPHHHTMKYDFSCFDCGNDYEYFSGSTVWMLDDDLWLSVVGEDHKRIRLCQQCIVQRLGRPLVARDFRQGHALHA